MVTAAGTGGLKCDCNFSLFELKSFFFFNSVQVTSALQLGGRQLNVEWGGKNAVLNRRGVTEEFDC